MFERNKIYVTQDSGHEHQDSLNNKKSLYVRVHDSADTRSEVSNKVGKFIENFKD